MAILTGSITLTVRRVRPTVTVISAGSLLSFTVVKRQADVYEVFAEGQHYIGTVDCIGCATRKCLELVLTFILHDAVHTETYSQHRVRFGRH